MRLSILLICLVSFQLEAQTSVDKYSLYYGGMLSVAAGKYKNMLTKSNEGITDGGFQLGVLFNSSKQQTSPLFLGGEFGFLGNGSDGVKSFVGGTFSVSNTMWWLNGVARYRPITTATKVNPFVDVAFGPKIISSGIFEKVGEEEYSKIDGKTRMVSNQGIALGIGFLLPSKSNPRPYLDISLNYQHSRTAKLIERNSVLITNSGNVAYREVATPTTNWQFRVNITRFR